MMKEQSKTKSRKKVSFDSDHPKLKLADIVDGAILIDTVGRKQLITEGIHRREKSSDWGYFETLSRVGNERIDKTIYAGQIIEEDVYGVHVHEVIPYKKPNPKRLVKSLTEEYTTLLNSQLEDVGL